jgi:uncharacterized membrane protein YsdA (DUF1294 family)
MFRRSNNYLIFGVLAAGAFMGLFLVLENLTDWRWYFNWLIAGSVVTFITYGTDKALAKANTSRVPEVILHLLALAGGFVGALMGMIVFRHKSNFRAHPLFLPIIIVGGVAWIYAIYWLSTRA